MKNVSRTKIASTDLQETNKQVNVELDRIRDLLDKVPDTFVTSTGGTTTPALTGKYVLPASSAAFGAAWATTGLSITIPTSGLYLITGQYGIYATAGADRDGYTGLFVNGVKVSGTGAESYLSATTAFVTQYGLAYTQNFNAGDVVAVYGRIPAGRTTQVYIAADNSEAFIQYTQLQSNVPVVATLGQDAWVGLWQDLTVAGANWTNEIHKGKFTKDSSGQWSVKLLITGSNSNPGNSFSLTITGVTFVAAAHGQPLTLDDDYDAYGGLARANGGTNTITYQKHASYGSTLLIGFSGEVLLLNKPTGYGIPDSV